MRWYCESVWLEDGVRLRLYQQPTMWELSKLGIGQVHPLVSMTSFVRIRTGCRIEKPKDQSCPHLARRPCAKALSTEQLTVACHPHPFPPLHILSRWQLLRILGS